MRGGVTGREDGRVIFARFANRDFVTLLDDERRDIDLAAIHLDMSVTHDLARLRAACAQTHPVDYAVETPFQRAQQVLARDAFHLDGFGEGIAELGFQHSVDAAHLLLFAKLQSVADDLLHFTGLSVLSGNEVAALDGTLLSVA